mgnify:CR=1 FL=1
MDFEEFLWATNNDVLAEEIREHYKTNEGLAESVHKMALDLYQKYLVVGGMPFHMLKDLRGRGKYPLKQRPRSERMPS